MLGLFGSYLVVECFRMVVLHCIVAHEDKVILKQYSNPGIQLLEVREYQVDGIRGIGASKSPWIGVGSHTLLSQPSLASCSSPLASWWWKSSRVQSCQSLAKQILDAHPSYQSTGENQFKKQNQTTQPKPYQMNHSSHVRISCMNSNSKSSKNCTLRRWSSSFWSETLSNTLEIFGLRRTGGSCEFPSPSVSRPIPVPLLVSSSVAGEWGWQVGSSECCVGSFPVTGGMRPPCPGSSSLSRPIVPILLMFPPGPGPSSSPPIPSSIESCSIGIGTTEIGKKPPNPIPSSSRSRRLFSWKNQNGIDSHSTIVTHQSFFKYLINWKEKVGNYFVMLVFLVLFLFLFLFLRFPNLCIGEGRVGVLIVRDIKDVWHGWSRGVWVLRCRWTSD